jgi:hypothetical protein
LGFQVRLVRLWEWETLIPKVTPLPQTSHFAISLHLLRLSPKRISGFPKSGKKYNSTLDPALQEIFCFFHAFFEKNADYFSGFPCARQARGV